jgi:acyl-CoA synthetase (NDP forming)/RimJ/RimL family protein N-acetyltransferase
VKLITRAVLEPFARDVLLATGRAVHVRAANGDDVAALRDFYARLGDTSTYYRFFGVRRIIPDDELLRATEQDIHRQVTLLAEADGHTIGVGEYHGLPDGDEAEVAFAVADAHHGEGIATVLLEDLALIARAAGYRRLVAEVLPGNTAMANVFRTVGLVHRGWSDGGTVHVQLDLAPDDVLQDHADLRDWQAAVRSLQPVLRPGHVVVIGAGGGDASKPGRPILQHLQSSFRGRVDVVDPSPDRVAGIGPAASVAELDHVPDLAVIAVAAPRVAEVIEQCGAAGVPAAVVVSAGFAELGVDGADRQDELLAAARRHGMRIVGPNCLGVVSTSCGLNATFTTQTFAPGGIAVGSQSGAIGIAIAAEAQRRRAGVSSFVSMGNKVDISGNDLLRFWADDDETRVVLLCLESLGDPLRFTRVARAVSQRKPVVAVTAGWTAPGNRGAASHTAAVTSDRAIVDALLVHTGVLGAGTLDELIDVGLLLDRQPAPAGRRIALIGNGGGPLILRADAAEGAGLKVPELSAGLQAEIARVVPGVASTANPVDLPATVMPDRLAAVVETVGRSGEVDSVVVVCADVNDGSLTEVGSLLDTIELNGVPLAVSLIGSIEPGGGHIPRFPSPERAAKAIAVATRRGEWLATHAAGQQDGPPADTAQLLLARRLARRYLAVDAAATRLDPVASFELLEAAGIAVARWRHVTSAEECAWSCETVGAPCVVKADVADLVHKSDDAGVVLGVETVDDARRAYRELQARFRGRLRGALVQAQVPAGVELLIGAIRHERFGPFVIVGGGGAEAELLDDRKLLVAPVSIADAALAVEGLRIAPLFHGFHGRPELPIDGVVALIQRVGLLASSVPEIQQLDLNPVLVGPHGCVAVDALVVVAEPPAPATPVRGLRGLRGMTR